jgi:hypothetical protein
MKKGVCTRTVFEDSIQKAREEGSGAKCMRA